MNLKKHIFKIVYEHFVSEGLIKTHDLKTSEKILRNSLKNKIKVNVLNNEGVIELGFYKQDVDINKLFKLINNLGYFVSTFKIKNGLENKYSKNMFFKKIKDENDNSSIELRLESKYDKNIVEIPRYVYHVTFGEYIEKIKKYGLSPKSKSKKSYHPERIYVASNLNNALNIASQLLYNKLSDSFLNPNKKEVLPDPYLIKIDTKKLGNVKFYNDPNFNKKGFYTLSCIPKDSFVSINEIMG